MYRTIKLEMSCHYKFRGKGPWVKFLAKEVISGRQATHVSGLYFCDLDVVRKDAEIPEKEFIKAFNTLLEMGFVRYDEERQIIFVVDMWDEQPHKGIHVERFGHHFRTLFRSPLILAWRDRYPEVMVDFPYDTILSPKRHPPVTQEHSKEGEGKGDRKGEGSTPHSPPRGRDDMAVSPEKPKKTIASHDRAVLELELAKIDPDPYRSKYGPQGLDFDACWEDFHDYVLNGDAKKPYPNPANWIQFGRALHDRCKWCLEKGRFMRKESGNYREEFLRGAEA